MATSPPPPPLRAALRRPWPWIALAFLVGIGLFLLATRGSKEAGFYRAGDVPPSTAAPDYVPLPAPMAGADGSGIGTLERPPAEIPTAPVEAPRPVAPPAAETRAAPPPRPAIADRKPRPLPGQTPAPDYPMRALREGATGTVLVLAHIGPDGVPTAAEIAQSSGSRDLDRAAMQAVRRWRFEPAFADGHPTVGEVVVPIDFKLAD